MNFDFWAFKVIQCTMIWYLNSKLDLNLSWPKVFWNPKFYDDLVYKLKKVVGSDNFQRSSLK